MHMKEEQDMLSLLSGENSVCNSPMSISGLAEMHCNDTARAMHGNYMGMS